MAEKLSVEESIFYFESDQLAFKGMWLENDFIKSFSYTLYRSVIFNKATHV